MTWVDSHCHIQLDQRDASVLIERAPDVDWMMVPGIDAASSEAAIRLASAYPDRVLAAAGLHPHEAESWPEQAARIEDLAQVSTAIGEIGLDFYRNLAVRQAQLEAFEAQLVLAKALGKPAIVHCRDAFADVFEVLDRIRPQTVMHCWTGGPRWTKRFLDLGVTFGFAGPIAFETGDTVRRGAAEVPPGRAMVETDSPYLAPPPHRHQENEPAWVGLVGEALAKVWGMTPAETAAATSRTAADVFGGPG